MTAEERIDWLTGHNCHHMYPSDASIASYALDDMGFCELCLAAAFTAAESEARALGRKEGLEEAAEAHVARLREALRRVTEHFICGRGLATDKWLIQIEDGCDGRCALGECTCMPDRAALSNLETAGGNAKIEAVSAEIAPAVSSSSAPDVGSESSAGSTVRQPMLTGKQAEAIGVTSSAPPAAAHGAATTPLARLAALEEVERIARRAYDWAMSTPATGRSLAVEQILMRDFGNALDKLTQLAQLKETKP